MQRPHLSARENKPTEISAERRQQYAAELSALSGIKDPALRQVFARVPREAFLPPGPWLIEAADASYYRSDDDDPDHILHGVGVVLDQQRSLHCASPARVGRAIQAAGFKPGDVVLHVGAGLGYYSAVMAELVGPAGRVLAAEIDPRLAEEARRNLAAWPNVEVTGDALSVSLSGVDVIFASCGMATIPRAWIDALRADGRMVLPLTGSINGGMLFSIRRLGNAQWARVDSLGFVMFYPCSGLRDQADITAFDAAVENGRGLLVRHLRWDNHAPDHDCWLHKDGWCLTAASPPEQSA